MNKMFLIGNLTRDPELSTIPSGSTVCKFGVAVNRRGGREGNQTDFYNVTVWGAMGENCAKYLKKGNKVGIVGDFVCRTYESNGEKKFSLDVNANDIEFLTPKGGQESGGMTPVADDSLPF